MHEYISWGEEAGAKDSYDGSCITCIIRLVHHYAAWILVFCNSVFSIQLGNKPLSKTKFIALVYCQLRCTVLYARITYYFFWVKMYYYMKFSILNYILFSHFPKIICWTFIWGNLIGGKLKVTLLCIKLHTYPYDKIQNSEHNMQNHNLK